MWNRIQKIYKNISYMRYIYIILNGMAEMVYVIALNVYAKEIVSANFSLPLSHQIDQTNSVWKENTITVYMHVHGWTSLRTQYCKRMRVSTPNEWKGKVHLAHICTPKICFPKCSMCSYFGRTMTNLVKYCESGVWVVFFPSSSFRENEMKFLHNITYIYIYI